MYLFWQKVFYWEDCHFGNIKSAFVGNATYLVIVDLLELR